MNSARWRFTFTGFNCEESSMLRKHLIGGVLIALVTVMGCAGDGDKKPASGNDPSNPAAPEGPAVRRSDALPGDSGGMRSAAGMEHEGHLGGTPTSRPAGELIYVCPMHSEVMQATAGKCPKCGMALVRKPAAGMRQ
jgi:hypothetical protein